MPDIAAGIKIDEAFRRVYNGLSNSPLTKYAAAYNSYHCPGDLRTKTRRPGAGWAFDSYSKANGMAGLEGWGTDNYKKVSQVLEASQAMVFLEESDPRNYNLGTWVLNVTPPGWIDPFAIFHGNVSTIGFADGHAELHKWVEATTIKAATDSANGRQAFNWAGGGSKNRDFRWVYDRYKHLAWKALP